MIKRIAQIILKLILKPEKAWQEIEYREESQEVFFNDYLYPLFGLITITTFVGSMWIGAGGGVGYALRNVIVVLTALFGGFHIGAFVMNEVYLKFEQLRDERRVRLFVGYSSAVVYLLYLVMPLIPGVEILWLLIVYTFYLVKEGVIHFLKIPGDRQSNFVLIGFGVVVLSPILIGAILGMVIK